MTAVFRRCYILPERDVGLRRRRRDLTARDCATSENVKKDHCCNQVLAEPIDFQFAAAKKNCGHKLFDGRRRRTGRVPWESGDRGGGGAPSGGRDGA